MTTVRVQKLPSGYVRIQGNGPCEWAQPPYWPCDEKTLREHTFPEASEKFIRECLSQIEECGSGVQL